MQKKSSAGPHNGSVFFLYSYRNQWTTDMWNISNDFDRDVPAAIGGMVSWGLDTDNLSK